MFIFNKTYIRTHKIDHIIATNGLTPVATLKGLTSQDIIDNIPIVSDRSNFYFLNI